MKDKHKEEVTPDQLMKSFKGSNLKTIIIFTVIIHIVVLGATSFPYLYRTIRGEDTTTMSEKDRTDAAMRKATVALREIAEEHGLKPQDLSNQLAGGGPKAPRAPKKETPAEKPLDGSVTEAEKAKSAIEEEISKKATGPDLPAPEDDEEDLFK